MSRNSPAVCIPSTASATAVDSNKLITKDAQSKKSVKQASEEQPVIQSSTIPHVHRNGHRIGINQRTRIMQKYVLGKTQTDIAKEESVDRESVRRIVKAPEVDSYVEAKRELWRGLCDDAIETLRQKLKEGDKEVALRILESNGVIPLPGATFNIQPATKATGDERVRQLMEAFAAVAIERARVFKTPMPELAEIAEERGIKLDFALNATDEPRKTKSERSLQRMPWLTRNGTAESVQPARPICLIAALIKRWYHRRTRLHLRFVGELDKPKPCESAKGLHS